MNALKCCATGCDQSQVPLKEDKYRLIYLVLLDHIENDWNSPTLGYHARGQLERVLNGVQ